MSLNYNINTVKVFSNMIGIFKTKCSNKGSELKCLLNVSNLDVI